MKNTTIIFSFKVLMIIALIFLVSACSSIPKAQVDDRILAWKGQHIDELIKLWGLPSKQNKVGDKNYAEWLNKSSEPGNTAISIGTGTHNRSSALGIGFTLFDLGAKDDQCSRLVIYDSEGIVSEINWQGTHNFCFEITPDLNKVKENKSKVQGNT